MSHYFTRESLDFLARLAANNRSEWFNAHKHEYESHVRGPFQRLLLDLQPILAGISPHFRAEPKAVGGSLFRIRRDTRYASDKSPYKPWQGARLYHARHRQVPAPAFYLHLQPGASFVAAGLWHPETSVLRQVRQFIFENPDSWMRSAHSPALHPGFALESEEMLKRPPAGFPADFAHIDDLRHRNFVLSRPLRDAEMTGKGLLPMLQKDLAQLAPFVDYLCAALDLDF